MEDGSSAASLDLITFDENGKRDGSGYGSGIPAARLKLIYRRMEGIRKAVGPDIEIILETHANPEITRSAIQIGEGCGRPGPAALCKSRSTPTARAGWRTLRAP